MSHDIFYRERLPVLSLMNPIHNHSYGTAGFRQFCVGVHEAILHTPSGAYRKRISDNCPILLRNISATLRIFQWIPITLLVFCLLLGTWGEKANATITTKEDKELGEEVLLEVKNSTDILMKGGSQIRNPSRSLGKGSERWGEAGRGLSPTGFGDDKGGGLRDETKNERRVAPKRNDKAKSGSHDED